MMKPDGAELVLSKSSIGEWLRCHYAWYLGYVHRIKGAPNLDMAIGTAVHRGAEVHWLGEHDPLLAAGSALLEQMDLMPTVPAVEARQALADVLAMTKLYIEKIVPTFYPTIIERDFLIRVDGQLVSGRIDAADDESVHDTKTTSTPSKVTAEHHQFGMSLYAWGFRALTGHLPDRLVLDVVAKNGRFKIVEVEPDYAGAAEVVGLVAKGILAGDFQSTGRDTGQCPRCPYRNICSFSNAVDEPAKMQGLESSVSGEGGPIVTAP